VRVERVQDLESVDAFAEGIYDDKIGFTAGRIDGVGQAWSATPEIAFFNLWRGINGERSLDDNPWVWALTFTVHQQNVDRFRGKMSGEQAVG
jgi:hypothetical protein